MDEIGRHTGNTITTEKKGRSVLEVLVWQNGLGLVVTIMTLWVSVDNLPFIALLLGISVEDVVGDNIDRVGVFGREEVGQDRSDGGHHSAEESAEFMTVASQDSGQDGDLPGDNDNGDTVLFAPEVKVLETTVEADVCFSANDVATLDPQLTVPQ